LQVNGRVVDHGHAVRAQRLHERRARPYWATISTIVAVQSSLVASWNLSWRRFAGTALGAAMGAALALLFAPSG